MSTTITMTAADWLSMLVHFMSLSLLAVGGAITTAPDIHRRLVDETHWLTESQFSSSIAIAQAAPGPNIMFIALMGWNIGLNAAGGLGAGVHALWLLVSSLGGGSDHHTSNGITYYRDSAWKMEMQMTTGWILFLVVVIGLGAATIAGAHRTLGAPAARKLLGDKRKRYLLYSWAGIPTVPLFLLFWVVLFALMRAVR